MTSRFDQGLAAMRKHCAEVGNALSPKPVDDPALNRQRGLAERIASRMVARDWKPGVWELYFNGALEAIQEFEQEFGGDRG